MKLVLWLALIVAAVCAAAPFLLTMSAPMKLAAWAIAAVMGVGSLIALAVDKSTGPKGS